MERHPIQERHDLPIEQRVQILESHLAQLWDMVWWMSLPPDRRTRYETEGYRAPIQNFYIDIDTDIDIE